MSSINNSKLNNIIDDDIDNQNDNDESINWKLIADYAKCEHEIQNNNSMISMSNTNEFNFNVFDLVSPIYLLFQLDYIDERDDVCDAFGRKNKDSRASW